MVHVWKLGGNPGISPDDYIDIAIRRKFVSVGWAGVESVRGKSPNQILEMFLHSRFRNYGRDYCRWAAGVLWTFANLVKNGDIVVLYDKRDTNKKKAFIGVVKNHDKSPVPYYYTKRGSVEGRFFLGRNNAPHRIEVERWFGQSYPFSLPQGFPWQNPIVEITRGRLRTIKMAKGLRALLLRQLQSPKPSLAVIEPTSENLNAWQKGQLGEAHGRKYGSGGEGSKHRFLKEWVYNHPEFLGISEVREKWMDPLRPYFLPTNDLPDIVFSYGAGKTLAVEVETYSPEPGAYQAIKYRTLICATKGLDLKSGDVGAALVAYKISSKLKSFCKRYGLTWREKSG